VRDETLNAVECGADDDDDDDDEDDDDVDDVVEDAAADAVALVASIAADAGNGDAEAEAKAAEAERHTCSKCIRLGSTPPWCATPKRAASGSELANHAARSSHADEKDADEEEDAAEEKEEEEDEEDEEAADETPRRLEAVGGAKSTLPASSASGSVNGTRKRASWCGAVESSARLTVTTPTRAALSCENWATPPVGAVCWWREDATPDVDEAEDEDEVWFAATA
jgi:hypothetical protein